MFNATSLTDLSQWHIFEQVFTKADLHDILISPNGRKALEELGANKINQLLKINHLSDDFPNEISQVVIDLFEDVNNFNSIFK